MVRPAGLWVVVTVLVGGVLGDPSVSAAGAVSDSDHDEIPAHVASIYEYAASTAPCPVSFATLAGIGAVTSDHTRVGGEPRLLPDGASVPEILYERLSPADPVGTVADTDGGSIDGRSDADTTVGPMQFLPLTWAEFGIDGNGDGVADPDNLWDAAAGAANRLCDAEVDTDLTGALTSYFGTDTYNDWVVEAIGEAATWQQASQPAPTSRSVEVITLETTVPAGSDLPAIAEADESTALPGSNAPAETLIGPIPTVDDVQVAGVEQVRPAAPSPSFIGPLVPALPAAAIGSVDVAGDWDGDGSLDSASLVRSSTAATIVRLDAEGRPYGRAIDVTDQIDLEPGSEQEAGLTIGEWDGDGVDDIALVVGDTTAVTATRFDRAGAIIDVVELGSPTADSALVVAEAAADVPMLDDAELWRTIEAPDGTELELWRVGGIIVDASIADQTSALLASAAAEGIELKGWGWRSHDAQIELRRAHCADVWTTPASQCHPPTAIPGTSRHEYGLAIDFHVDTASLSTSTKEFAWLLENAERFGFFNLPSEPWHWSVDGG